MGEHAQTGEVVVPSPVAFGIVDLVVHFHAKHGSRAEEVEEVRSHRILKTESRVRGCSRG